MGSPWDTHIHTRTHTHTQTNLSAAFTAVQNTSVHWWGVAGKLGVGGFFTGSGCCKILSMFVRVCDTVVGRHSARRGDAVVAELPRGDTRHCYRLQLTRSFISNAWRVTRESWLLAQLYWILLNSFSVSTNPYILAFNNRVTAVHGVWLS